MPSQFGVKCVTFIKVYDDYVKLVNEGYAKIDDISLDCLCWAWKGVVSVNA
jgi:hypothetical protein